LADKNKFEIRKMKAFYSHALRTLTTYYHCSLRKMAKPAKISKINTASKLKKSTVPMISGSRDQMGRDQQLSAVDLRFAGDTLQQSRSALNTAAGCGVEAKAKAIGHDDSEKIDAADDDDDAEEGDNDADGGGSDSGDDGSWNDGDSVDNSESDGSQASGKGVLITGTSYSARVGAIVKADQSTISVPLQTFLEFQGKKSSRSNMEPEDVHANSKLASQKTFHRTLVQFM
jgi:hypothetical protein